MFIVTFIILSLSKHCKELCHRSFLRISRRLGQEIGFTKKLFHAVVASSRIARIAVKEGVHYAAMRLLAIISVLAISSCVQFHDQLLSATKSLDSFESRTLNQTDPNTYIQAHIPAGQWPLQTWDLTSLTLAAFFYHPDLDGARRLGQRVASLARNKSFAKWRLGTYYLRKSVS
jgi:hypothetical protein